MTEIIAFRQPSLLPGARAARLRFQTAAAAFAFIAASVAASQYARYQKVPADSTPYVSASTAPFKYRGGADDTAEDAFQSALIAADGAEAPADLPKPSRQTAARAGANPGGPLAPKMVKTIALRPDGTLIDAADGAALTTRAADLRNTLAAMTAASGVTTPGKPEAAERAAAVPADTTIVKTQTPPIVPAAASAPAVSARAQPSAAAYFIQLASSPNEEEAQKLADRLRTRLSGDLGRRDLTIWPASVKDRPVYRIRVAELSKEEAGLLCSKLRSSRAVCFVARD